jgi:hypothetical protein
MLADELKEFFLDIKTTKGNGGWNRFFGGEPE